ncbi:MAG: nodulation protein NfeD [Proteobacteria bacterium]|nr:nodulation protein NfeD [Pseudomonadota bacterium]
MIVLLRILFFLLIFSCTLVDAEPSGSALLLKINGVISPPTQDYIHRGLSKAVAEKDKVVILQIDTPGGLSDSMRAIIQDILASPIPVFAFVAPSGARAASAGTYIVYASHIAAMAPGTNIGAASPVSIGGGRRASSQSSVAEQKAMQDAQAYIRSLAELRHRNVHWAEAAVTQAASLTANQALQQKVIDIISVSPEDLLQQANGKVILIGNQWQPVASQNLIIKTWEPDWRTRLLAIITYPSIAYILLIIGIYGLFFELLHPGLLMPGIVGIITLLLALYAFQLLPVNYTGLTLIIVGMGCIVAELFLPTYGALGMGGALAFLVGSIMLLKSDGGPLRLPLGLIIGATGLTLLFFLGILGFAVRARRRPVVSGREGMIGQVGEVIINENELWIRVSGERWQAHSDQPLALGQKVTVVAMKGLVLKVEPMRSE